MKLCYRRWMPAALLGWLGLGLLTAFAPVARAGEEKPLVVGMELAFAPFEMVDAEGRPAGISVEMAKVIAARLGRELKIENMPFDGLIPSLKTGKIDLIISSMTATAQRAKSIDFSDPYCSTGLALLIAKDSPVTGIENLDEKGRRVAVKQGTTGQVFGAGNFKNAALLVFDREDAAVLEVVQGKVDAFIYDQVSVYRNWERNKDRVRVVLAPFQKESWAIGVRKGNSTLLAEVNQALAQMKKDGVLEKLGDQYLKDQKDAFKALGYPFYF